MTYPPSTSPSWKEGCAFMTGLPYSPLHLTEFCGEMQGKFEVGLARLKSGFQTKGQLGSRGTAEQNVT